MAGISDKSASKARQQRRWLIIFAASAFVLALVFIAMAMFSSPEDEPELQSITLSASEESDSLYEDALTALASGDATKAVGLLALAVEKNPSNKTAVNKLAEVQAEKPEPPVTPTDTPALPADPNAGYTAAVADLATLLPATATGYELSQPLTTDTDAQLSAEGLRTGPMPTVRTATFYAHDMGSVEAASSFIDNQAPLAFPKNGAEVKVNGFDAYFGTDGDQLAVVAFSRGRFAFEAILVARPGTQPASLLDAGVASAKYFPASR